MANWNVTTYDSLKASKTAIEAIDNTSRIHLLGFLDGMFQKITVINGG